ncbi:hypothetical protein [Streptomyces sediminimaris]|uniref:hypothetical protein n=1 Tax=Streptomyces sediminimaris TaxID=3383721 RepID=UPI00399AE33F
MGQVSPNSPTAATIRRPPYRGPRTATPAAPAGRRCPTHPEGGRLRPRRRAVDDVTTGPHTHSAERAGTVERFEEDRRHSPRPDPVPPDLFA